MKNLLIIILLCSSTICGATNRALVFGLGSQQDPAWGRIHGDRDVAYVVKMLATMDYTDIVTLRNKSCTKQAMVEAFRKLAARCRRGDKVYVHYSGHGQLMTDLDGDESLKWQNSHAQWDESWIPYDAYMVYGPDDRGEKHLTDDEVASLLLAIRKKIGSRGELVVVVDACHSGDATCGPEDEAVRGVDMRFCVPRPPGQVKPAAVADEAWLTVSACKPYQLCTEMKDLKVGKLTYALYKLGPALLQASNEEIERVLLRFMEQHKGRLPQTPMVRGKK